MRLVRYRVNTSPDIVDDACAFAWVQFMRSQPDRNRQWRGWLLTTAEREAWRMHREQARDLRADLTGDAEPAIEPEDPRDRQAARGDLRHALDLLAAVPERRRRAKALQLMGFSYQEIADVLGISFTRVNQLITEANAVIRREQVRTDARQRAGAPCTCSARIPAARAPAPPHGRPYARRACPCRGRGSAPPSSRRRRGPTARRRCSTTATRSTAIRGDAKPEDTNGQRLTDFGAAWFAVSGAGQVVSRLASKPGGKSIY